MIKYFIPVLPLLLFLACTKQPLEPAMTDDDIAYRVEAVTVNDTDSVSGAIKTDTVFALYIPNAFSPDGDGINDFFSPTGMGIKNESYRMEIYNRWNNLVFSSDDIDTGWNGKIKGKKVMPNTSFTYILELNDILGEKYRIMGSVFIID